MNTRAEMQKLTLKHVAEACGGRLLQGAADGFIQRVCNDSRAVRGGDLFFAIAGDNFDGHDFLTEVDSRHAGAVVVDIKRQLKPARLNCGIIGVENPRRALGELAAHYRDEFEIPVIAVGGSNGKTSAKELVASVLRQKLKTVWSEASFNNDIGVPLTLLNIADDTQAAVVEVGTNHPGEMKSLLRIIRPKMGIMTSIGREHLEFFKDVKGVELEEGALAEMLPEHGTLFVHGDEPWADRIAGRTRANVVRVGLLEGNHWRAVNITLNGAGYDFDVVAGKPEFSGRYRLNLLGRHQIVNGLYALAVGAELGLGIGELKAGLAACRPAKMRMQTWEWNGVTVLDDAYNANADSMRAALETLKEMPCAGRRVAVLGDMAELGDQTWLQHQEVGRLAALNGVNHLFAVGKMADCLAEAARLAGLKDSSTYTDPASVAEPLKEFLKPGDVLLLKASRSTRMERLVAALKGDSQARKD